MRINSEVSLKVATGTFNRFKGDWTAVHRQAHVDEHGILVIRPGTAPVPAEKSLESRSD